MRTPPLRGRALYVDPATVLLHDDAVCRSEPQAGPETVAFCGVEGIEDARQVLGLCHVAAEQSEVRLSHHEHLVSCRVDAGIPPIVSLPGRLTRASM